jgi:hypothetical protein
MRLTAIVGTLIDPIGYVTVINPTQAVTLGKAKGFGYGEK